jgi:hypothetical protein
MRGVIGKILKGIYKLNVFCALLMMCSLDSNSLIPAIVLAVNMLIILIPFIAYEVTK